MSANSTSAGSSETPLELLSDRINLIAATTALGVTYGIMVCLYSMTTYSLIKKLIRYARRPGSHSSSITRYRMEWRNTIFYLVFSSILFVLATLYTAGNSQNAIIAYVDNRLYPGGPAAYYVTFMAGQKNMDMLNVASLLILWMTDALILCRFIMIYWKVPYARWIIPFPCAMYVGVVVLSTIVLNSQVALHKIFYLTENLLLVYYALSLSLNILTTALIAGRLYWHKVQLDHVLGGKSPLKRQYQADLASRNSHVRSPFGLVYPLGLFWFLGRGTESPYLSVATVLVESAALYGVWSIVVLILCARGSPGLSIMLATICQIQVIAPLLITLWFARGKAWNYGKCDSQGERSSGTVGFNSRPGGVGGACEAENVCPNTVRNASWCTTVGSSKIEKRTDDGNIELGLCDSKHSIIADDVKSG